MIDVSVVIVNYKVKYFLEQTILSVKEALRNLQGEIIVIDNNSQDDSIAYLRGKHPDVIYIENTDNPGFAKANNQGFRVAQGKYTLILNPDTVIGRDTLTDCIEWYDSHPDCGGIGVEMVDGNGNFLPESKRAFPTPWVSFCKIFGLSALFPRTRTFAKYHLRYLDKRQPHKVDILAGAFIFVRTELLRQCGGFDEDYFMYGEDIDLSYKFHQAGFTNYYLPTPIIHYKGESTQKDSMKYVRIFYEAMLIFFRKHYPHYSTLYYFFIKAAVSLRALIAMSRRVLTRIFTKKAQTKKPVDTLLILSKDPARIAAHLNDRNASCLSSETLSMESCTSGKNAIVIDNRIADYQDIIEFIIAHSNPDNTFHIYSSQADLIISPKMKQL